MRVRLKAPDIEVENPFKQLGKYVDLGPREYIVGFEVIGGFHIDVDADSIEDALDEAEFKAITDIHTGEFNIEEPHTSHVITPDGKEIRV